MGSNEYWNVPSDGMCLSAYLLLSYPSAPDHVLAGRIDPGAPWDRIGGLDPKRATNSARGWMLPSSQLLRYESPQDAGTRILREQLEVDAISLGPVEVYSEAYPRPQAPAGELHWDFHFLQRGTWPHSRGLHASPWTELAMVDVPRTRRADFVRGQGDILDLAGIRPAD